MFYIGINQAVHPTDKTLSGNNIFAIICVYLFVVFYSFGWGPIPFILASECSPNHGKSWQTLYIYMCIYLYSDINIYPPPHPRPRRPQSRKLTNPAFSPRQCAPC